MSDSSALWAQWGMSPGSVERSSFTRPLSLRTIGFESLRERKELRAPTLGEIDILLSLSTTTRLLWDRWPAWFSASKAMPAVMPPSPIIAMAQPSLPRCCMARAMPSAAEIEVPAWPAPKWS